MEKNGGLSLFKTSVKETDVCIHYDVSLYQRIRSIQAFPLIKMTVVYRAGLPESQLFVILQKIS